MPYRNTSTRSVITPTTLEKHLIQNNAPNPKRTNPNEKRQQKRLHNKLHQKSTKSLAKYASLSEPEAVKHFIAQHNVSDGYKRKLCMAYNKYCKYYK
jgi:hypothetical protein